MTCTEFLAMLDDLIDASIAAETRSAIQAHLRECEHCEVVLDTTRKTIEVYRSHEVFELPTGVSERLHAVIRAKCCGKH